MPLWNFHKYSETQDLRYFTKRLKLEEGLEEVKKEFLKEYYSLTKNKQAELKEQIIKNIMVLSNKYDSVTFLIYSIRNFDTRLGREMLLELVSELKNWKYKIDEEKELFSQLSVIEERLQGIKTKIVLLESELANEEPSKEKTSLTSQVLTVSRILEMHYKINPKKTSVLEWIEMQEQCRIIAERQEQEKLKKNGKRN